MPTILKLGIMKKYIATINSDHGKHKLIVLASDKETAIEMILKAEGCPDSAIFKMQEVELYYKVVKIYRVSGRREVLRRNLTEEEARRVVNSYKDRYTSMVVYMRQNNYSHAKKQ